METMTVVEQAPLVAEVQAQSAESRWSLPARIGFRFAVVYFGLYCVLTQIINSVLVIPKIDMPDWAALPPIRPVVFWVAAHVFHLKTPLVYQGSGSGDKQFDWVLVFCMLVTAAVATAVWSVLDRRRAAYPKLHAWFWLFLRFCLAGQMFVYGMIKALPLQMPYPFLSKLVEPFGNMSPMGVLWYSIGAAPHYETFAGCAELLGGLLLIFPRTRTLGALVALADMTQVFMLNMFYDVPVKQFSFHLIVMSLLLLSPEVKRLANFLLLNRVAEPAERKPLFAGRRAQRIAVGVIAFLWVWMLGNGVYSVWDDYRHYGPRLDKSGPLYGIWNIQEQSVDGQPKPLLVTDAQGWRRIIFDFPQYIQVQKFDDSMSGFAAVPDLKANTLKLTDPKTKVVTGTFAMTRMGDKMTLDGTLSGHKTTMALQRQDEKKFLLESRGFHWVQDYPFNR